MMKLAFIVAVVAASAAALPHTQMGLLSPVGRIVGGEAATVDQFPYQAALLFQGYQICGGSIIASKWILTAAHCLVYEMSRYRVRTGSSHSQSGGAVHEVKDQITHEKYGTNRNGIPRNDIGLMQLMDEIIYGKFQKPIAMYKTGEEASAGKLADITGWGTLNENGGFPEVLQTVSVPIISKEECSEAYAFLGGLPEGQICAAYPKGGKDTCQGDSGGPLAINERLAGVVSWGNGCARPGYPGAYTEVATYREWINEKCGF